MIDRIKHIDIAKGISISLVALFHSKLGHHFSEIIEPMALFRMPLFFLLAGVFFSWSANPKDFLLKKSEALLKPYFSVLFLLFFVSIVSGGDTLTWELKGIFYGNGDTIKWVSLWFLSHIFVVYCFAYVLFRFTGFPNFSLVTKGIILLAFMLVGSAWIDLFWYQDIQLFSFSITLPGLPFSLDIILLTSTYFVLGSLLKTKLTKFHPTVWTFLLSIAIFFCVSQLTNAHTDFNKRVYDYPIYATLGAVSGIYLMLSISHIISKSNWLSLIPIYLGKGSLYILIFHSFIDKKIYVLFADGINDESALVLLSVISFGFSIFIPLLIKWVVENNDVLSLAFLPFKSNKLLQRTLYARR